MYQQISILSYKTQKPKVRLLSRRLLQSQQRHDHVVAHVTANRAVQLRRFATIIPLASTSYQSSSYQINGTSLNYCLVPFGSALTTQRLLSDVTPRDVDGNEEEKTTIPTKEPPELTAEMKEDLAILKNRFLRLELEPHGRYRGIELTQRILREELLEKRATKPLANLYLNNWIYRRYSLQLGYENITDVPGDVLANTLIREGTTIRFWKYKNPKTILKEMFRFAKRPTKMQQRYIEKDHRAMSPTSEDANNPSSATTTPTLTPEEEEREKRMWDPTLFQPKPYGTKARRIAEKRKRRRAQKY